MGGKSRFMRDFIIIKGINYKNKSKIYSTMKPMTMKKTKANKAPQEIENPQLSKKWVHSSQIFIINPRE